MEQVLSGQVATKKKKLLLMLLPFWTPSIPPLGISIMKSLLGEHGHDVRTHDANMDIEFRALYDSYFRVVREVVPAYKRGNFFNIGMDVMRNHMMAHINSPDQEQYNDLIKQIFFLHYYCTIDQSPIDQLKEILNEYYRRLNDFIVQNIAEFDPDIFGLSVFSGNLASSVFAFRVVKLIRPSIVTVMGGGTFSMELCKDNPNFERLLSTEGNNIDKIFIGEADYLFLQYVQGELDDNKKVYDGTDLKGKPEMARIPIPNFSDLDLEKYPQLGYWTARSCPYQCSFCSETIYWGRYRKKEAKQMVREMATLHERHKGQVFMMGDSLLNPVIDSLTEEIAKSGAALYFDGYLRTDPPVCDEENTMKWRRGGYYRARLGVESGAPEVLKAMNKKITVDQIRQSIRALANAGIKTTTYWIAGHPGETEEEFEMTLALLEELAEFIWEAEVNPFSYYLTGQVNSDKWMSEYERVTIYPERYTNLLLTQTWEMKGCYPTREVIYDRVNKFVDHCYKLGIPNPYSEMEIYDADVRWKKLHKNAVPPLIDFRNTGALINDLGKATRIVRVKQGIKDTIDFSF
jgi:radical SAM superfamily enzyme YgiQ (UPF0313 family)